MPQPLMAEFDNVTKEYSAGWWGRRRLRAVSGISFTIAPGEVIGLLGPNRAGKTTLAKLLLSLCHPTSGRVTRLGRPATDRATLARVGYVHERAAFPRHLTAVQLLDYFGALGRLPQATRKQRIPEWLERVGLTDRGHEPIARFSKGMVQRLALAQALLNAPDLLILDEPSEGLDLEGRRLAADLIREQVRHGRSALLITHVLADAERLCDRIAVLSAGKLVYLGPPKRLVREEGVPLERALPQRCARPVPC